MLKKRSIYLNLLIALIIFFLIAYFVPGRGKDEFITLLLSITSFMFAIFLAFSTANRHSRLTSIRERLRNGDALILSIYNLSKIFGKKISDKCRKIIDDDLIIQIDYELVDYDKSTSKFLELYTFISKIKAKVKSQSFAKDHMLYNIDDYMKNRKEITYRVRDKMYSFEWISLITLCGIILFCLFYVNNGSIISIITIPLLSTCLVLLLFVLKELNNLSWQEKEWVWFPLADLFKELGLLPYFPEDIFLSGMIKPKELKHIKKYRYAHYPNTPSPKGKVVKIIKNK